MKILFPFLIALLFVGCGTPKPQTSPQWYKNRELQSAVKYEIIGYGEGKTIKEAEATAKENIAHTLISKIDSSFTSSSSDYKKIENNSFKILAITDKDEANKKETELITKSDTNIVTVTNVANLKITSNLNLHNVKTIKQEQINGLFYVALKYKNLDLAYRVKTTVGKLECNKNQVTSYLLQTPLIKKLTASLGCKLDFKLDRRNEAWYLKYKEHLFLLSTDEFEELFTSTKNSNAFEIISNKPVLTDGDSFYFTVNAKEKGYVTLLNVYENGIVTLLQPSTPIKKSIQIPSKDSDNYFEAGLVKEGVNTYDLYVAIYIKEPLDMSRFEYADEDLAESELAYKFDELIRVINENEYSSLLLRTRAK